MMPMKKTMNLWLFMAIMVLMVVAFGIVNARIVSDTEDIQRQHNIANKKVSDLKNVKQDLEDELDTIDTDAFVERQARDEYDYMMPDELRFVISFPDEETQEPSL